MKKPPLCIGLICAVCTLASADAPNLLKADTSLDGTVNNLDLAQLADEWLSTGLPYAPVTKPFPGPGRLRCSQVQRQSVSAGQWATVFDINDGPALVTGFWLACDFPTNPSLQSKNRKTPLRIYFDDHNTPDIEGLTGEIFGSGFEAPANFRGTFAGVTNSKEATEGTGVKGFSGYLRLPMPYYHSIRVDIQNTASSSGLCWMMLERLPMDPNRLYCIGLEPGMYLRTCGYGLGNRWSAYAQVTLLDTNCPTILAGIFHFFDNGTAGGGANWYYLEGDYRIYYADSNTPSYQSPSTEDFYHSSWYFEEGLFDRMDESLVYKENYIIAACRFFPLERAPACENGIKFTWQVGENGGGNPGNTYTSWIVWYYQ
jgi:hypothetical protein